MKNACFKKRVEKVRKTLVAKRLDGLLITAPADVSYLSGFVGEDSWLFVGRKTVWLITDSRYAIQAKEQCRVCKIYIRKRSMAEALADVLKKTRFDARFAARRAGRIKTIAVEDNIKLASFKSLKKKIRPSRHGRAVAGCRIKTVRNIILTIRQIKDQAEVGAIKKAAALAQNALERILPRIHAGISEAELAAILDFEMKKQGGKPAFETIVAFGSNAAKPHHRPTKRKLKKIDTVLLDFGAKLNSYCSDITRCFAVGKVNDFYKKAYKTVLEAQTNAINMLKAGIEAKKLDAVAKGIIKKSKLPPYEHGLGHGLGLEVHERPIVSSLSKDILQAGNVITVEPAVYLENKFGIRIEDDVLITENGCEILSSLLKSNEVPVLKIKNQK